MPIPRIQSLLCSDPLASYIFFLFFFPFSFTEIISGKPQVLYHFPPASLNLSYLSMHFLKYKHILTWCYNTIFTPNKIDNNFLLSLYSQFKFPWLSQKKFCSWFVKWDLKRSLLPLLVTDPFIFRKCYFFAKTTLFRTSYKVIHYDLETILMSEINIYFWWTESGWNYIATKVMVGIYLKSGQPC